MKNKKEIIIKIIRLLDYGGYADIRKQKEKELLKLTQDELNIKFKNLNNNNN